MSISRLGALCVATLAATTVSCSSPANETAPSSRPTTDPTGSTGAAPAVPVCDRVDLGDGDVLYRYTHAVSATTTVGTPIEIDLAAHLDLPATATSPCITINRRDVPAGTYLGEFSVAGTTVSFTPPMPNPADDFPCWGTTAAMYCVDGLEDALYHCSGISVDVIPEMVSGVVDRFADPDTGNLPGLNTKVALLSDMERESMLVAGTSPADVALVQSGWYGVWVPQVLDGLGDPLARYALAAACGGYGGAVAESYEIAIDAMNLVADGFDMAMIQIDAMLGVAPPESLRVKVTGTAATVDAAFKMHSAAEAYAKTYGPNPKISGLPPAGLLMLQELCDLAVNLPSTLDY
jgi:hypothetical protein